MILSPSPQQLEAFRNTKRGPLVLFYEFTAPDAQACAAGLALAAQASGGELRWMGDEQEVLCGRIQHFGRALTLHFGSREAALDFITSPAHAQAVASCTALQVAVISEQPKILGLLSAVFARLMPIWPFDNTIESGEEPGIGTSTMPTAQTIAAVRTHPDQSSPVTMINWLKFRERADYQHGEPPASGRAAYLLYGKVAMTTTHSLGAKLIFASRYRQILVGNNGDPGLGLWDEFALMQYPGRATFGRMAQLRRYRRALNHRAAGLAEYGQGLTLSRPAPEFTWKR